MAEKRRRGQNFVIEEKYKLVKLLSSPIETILNKKTDGPTNEAKNNAWKDVTNAFNSSASLHRNKDSLMKLWEKMKTDSKLYYQSTRKSTSATGGGPLDVKLDPIMEQVCALLGHGCTGILGVQDCHADGSQNNSLPLKMCLNEDKNETGSSFIGEAPKLETISNTEVQIMEDHKCKSDVTSENYISPPSPLWSRRQLKYFQTNERTEAISSICSRFNSVNKKKEDLEDLKKQLLQDEINFKKKLYEVQLETARKELEIKTEILRQIKGASINMQHLFGIPKIE